jgi:hypothetical protein
LIETAPAATEGGLATAGPGQDGKRADDQREHSGAIDIPQSR